MRYLMWSAGLAIAGFLLPLALLRGIDGFSVANRLYWPCLEHVREC